MKKLSLSGSKVIIIYRFRTEYEHPLVIGNVRRKANTLGIEVKTVNDWQ